MIPKSNHPTRAIMSSEDDSQITSPQNRKSILRDVLKSAQSLTENVNKNTMTNLEFIMDKADMVNNESSQMDNFVEDQEQVVLDAQVLSITSGIMRKVTLNVTKELNNYDPLEFASNIQKFLQRNSHTEETDWSVLDEIAVHAFLTMPQYSSLQGYMKPIQAKDAVVKKQQAKRDARMPVKRPKCVTVADKDEASVEDSVEKIRRLVQAYHERTQEPLHFFKLVLHPTNFGRTVENLLHTSFLLRDGHFKLVKDRRGALIIETVSKKVLKEDKKSGKGIGIQNVFSINEDDWRALVKAYNIQEPMVVYET